ncbi:MAG TPA: homoserine O-succinyltransferase [Solirubrobacteraceae bacterium]|nr:homoserine O-succinyltransferase [Solirubrobacteraceae bacterium]
MQKLAELNPRPITVALVNNMPDSAFLDTENQFRGAAEHSPAIEFELFTIKETPRSDKVAALIEERYRGLDELWAHPPDALIVTGTEPTQVQLRFEPYWPYLARLLEWAAQHVRTTLLSCMASHASLLLFDGIERTPRPVKCSGVCEGRVHDASDPLASGLPEVVRIPHSRINDVPEAALVDAGYRIVVGAGYGGAGWSVAARTHRDGLFVLCQGHPEYGTLSLLREYRRDVRRSLFGRGAVPYPRLPDGYLGEEAVEKLKDFERRARARDIDPRGLWPTFPFDAVAATVENSWAPTSATLYSNWLRWAREAVPGQAPDSVLRRAA